MFQKGRIRLLPALALAAVLALALTPPAGAAGWAAWGKEGRQLAVGLVTSILERLNLGWSPSMTLKCIDDGASIDPNGCPKATPDDRSTAGPEGLQLSTWRRSESSGKAH
jgi:hypothetical protein